MMRMVNILKVKKWFIPNSNIFLNILLYGLKKAFLFRYASFVCCAVDVINRIFFLPPLRGKLKPFLTQEKGCLLFVFGKFT
jgi:hypothetical protein